MTDQSVNRSRTTEEDSERVAYQVKVQEKIQTTWLFDTEADAHVMPKFEWEQLGEPTLQTTRETLRGANGQDLGAVGVLPVRKFHSENQSSVHSSGCTRRCLLNGTQLRAKGYTFTLNQQESFFTQPKGRTRVTMSREGNRDTPKVVCMLKPRDAQSVNYLMWNREFENARRELGNLKTGQHENKGENAEGKIDSRREDQ